MKMAFTLSICLNLQSYEYQLVMSLEWNNKLQQLL